MGEGEREFHSLATGLQIDLRFCIVLGLTPTCKTNMMSKLKWRLKWVSSEELVTWCRRDEGAAKFRRLILHIVQEQFSVGVRSNALMK